MSQNKMRLLRYCIGVAVWAALQIGTYHLAAALGAIEPLTWGDDARTFMAVAVTVAALGYGGCLK